MKNLNPHPGFPVQLLRSWGARCAALLVAVLLVGGLAAPAWAHDAARTAPITVESRGVTFQVDAPVGMERFARRAAEVVEEGWPQVSAALGLEQGEGVIEVAVERELEQWFERQNVPTRSPEWAAGLAMYDISTVLVRSANPEWESTLLHELAHMAVDMATGGRRVPRWFNEGLAVTLAEQWSIERATTMIRAGISGRFYSFEQLERGFPAASSSADLAYAQSSHFVRQLKQNYGDRVFMRLLGEIREGATWDDAFESATGHVFEVVELEWARHVSTRYKWTPMLGGGGGWGLMALLGSYAWRRHHQRKRARLDALARQEAGTWSRDPDDEVFG